MKGRTTTGLKVNYTEFIAKLSSFTPRSIVKER